MNPPFRVQYGPPTASYHIGPRPEVNPELQRKRAIQDAQMAEFHAYLDEAAKDLRHKHERPQFAVVTASEAFRRGWERIFTPQEQSAPGK